MRFALLVLCGCNEVFGLNPTRIVDAHTAPLDAYLTCPPPGTAPAFSTLLHQGIEQNCFEYSISADGSLAVAACVQGPVTTFEVGAPGEALMPAPGVPQNLHLAPTGYAHPRLSPDGSTLYLVRDDQRGGENLVGLTAYRRSGGMWIADTPPVPAFTAGDWPSTIAGTADHARWLIEHSNQTFSEWTFDGTTWTAPVARAVPGVTSAQNVMVGADGLRMMLQGFLGTPRMRVLYSDRPSLDADFRAPVALDAIPPGDAVSLAPDCNRSYFNGLESVFYAQQQ